MEMRIKVADIIFEEIWDVRVGDHITRVKFEKKGDQLIAIKEDNSIVGFANYEDVRMDFCVDSIKIYGTHYTLQGEKEFKWVLMEPNNKDKDEANDK